MPRTKVLKLINVEATSPDFTADPYWDFVIFQPDKPCKIFNVRMDLLMFTNMSENYDLRDPEVPKKWNQGSTVYHYLWKSQPQEAPVFAEETNNSQWLPESLCTDRLVLYGHYHVDMPGVNNQLTKTTGGMNVPAVPYDFVGELSGVPPLQDLVGGGTIQAHDIPYAADTVVDYYSGDSTYRDVQSVDCEIFLDGDMNLRWMGHYTRLPSVQTGTRVKILFEVNLYY